MKEDNKSHKSISDINIESYYNLYARRNHLRHKLSRPEKWMPRYLMKHPDVDPSEVLDSLQKETRHIQHQLRDYSDKEGITGPREVPLPDAGLPPLRERILKNIGFVRELERLKEGTTQIVAGLEMGAPEESPGPEEPTIITNLGTANEMINVMTVYSYDTGDDYTEIFYDEWKFDTYISVNYGRLDFRTDVKRSDYGRLAHHTALVFDNNGIAPFDGLFVWQADSILKVPYYINADDASFKADWITHQRIKPNEVGRQPFYNEFYSLAGLNESVSDSRKVGVWENERALSGAMAVSAGDKPEVYIGVAVTIEVEDDGRAGTKWDWGSLLLPGPDNYGFWGIEYSYIPL